MAANFTFVTQGDPGHRSGRRVRSRKACDMCRYKKRRCNHQSLPSLVDNFPSPRGSVWMESHSVKETQNGRYPVSATTGAESDNTADASQDGSIESVDYEEQQHGQEEEQQQQQQQQHPRSDAHASSPTPRFVSDLNPEARLLDETVSPEDAQDIAPGEVGVWVQSRPCSEWDNTADRSFTPITCCQCRRVPRRCLSLVSDLLPDNTIKALSDLYFANMHPIIPLLNEEEYYRTLSQCTTPMPLVHVVCLLAAKDNGAGKHLKLLQSGDTLMSVRQFCSQLHASLTTALSRRTTIRKITLIRILGLLSLHHEGSDGAEQASSCVAQAMQHAQSLAMHLPRPKDVDFELKRTFWCLWTLDRLNAATHSRPCIMADIDIEILYLTPKESGSVAFDVWFRISKMLNNVIGLYRPNIEESMSGLDSGFPGFEQIMEEMRAWQLPQSTIATLHIFFLATAILAHRLKSITTLPSPTPARLRQQLSSIQVIRYMQDPTRSNALHPFPIAVYATSLALSVSFQQLRYSQLASDQEDARQDFNTACNILQALRRKWGSADAMASLALKISGALDKLPCLDLLRVIRPDRAGRDGRPADGCIYTPERLDDQRSVDFQLAGRPPDPDRTLSDIEAMDLFAGMDDVSWMYLDAENPVSFDSFPLMNLSNQYDAW